MTLKAEEDGLLIASDDWLSLKEHAINVYLPFLGGVGSKTVLNYSAPRGKIIKWYVVKFELDCVASINVTPIRRAQDLCDFRSPSPLNDPHDWRREDEVDLEESGIKISKQILRELLVKRQTRYLSEGQCIDHWCRNGFEIYGARGDFNLVERDGSEQSYGKKSKEFVEWESLPRNIDLGNLTFLKTGLSAISAQSRGGSQYTEIIYEAEISDPAAKWRGLNSCKASSIETIIHLKMLYSFWKDICWFYHPTRINYDADSDEFYHPMVRGMSPGLTESWLLNDQDEKVDLAVRLFEFLNSCDMSDLGAIRQEIISFFEAWTWVLRVKQYVFVHASRFRFTGDQSAYALKGSFRKHVLSIYRPPTNPAVLLYLRQIGFYEMWIPDDFEDLSGVFESVASTSTDLSVSHWSDGVKAFGYDS